MPYFIGLMSGTSVDGVDAVLCDIQDNSIKLIESLCLPIAEPLQNKIHAIASSQYQHDPIEMMGHLDVEIGDLLAQAVAALLEKTSIAPSEITAIGSHGQTIRHIPNHVQAFTLQIGDPNIIAAKTGIDVVADFRRRDMALGGQGAPLVPAFHHSIFKDAASNRVIVNLGGIANITLLTNNSDVIGYDTGPANTLMDQWIKLHKNQSFDPNGDWAKSGQLDGHLLEAMLGDPYFTQAAPKSTGREYFNLGWLNQFDLDSTEAADVQRTLLELTAQTLSDSIDNHLDSGEIYLCGGGVHNEYLAERIQTLIPSFTVQSTYQLGVDPDWVEAMAFAWLAERTINRKAGNLAAVTGASQDTILGAIYPT
ncbi:anhydro-N-acetylmuramic acid kinase [Kangiella sp. HZ709]|uniref:anhydro-N-acetylmuramic acid kinase n=1 Tax=Kangiella sp. HZ709 TaxID=2666328 RepID=UPI0012AFEAB4|nr:anhydro-N-acetylmuramic acid kinase [Kangiella sp. HZ709]MRX28273.1 anhydro-N-acetylmuramic acid kinase [Kangiella sp. HZ709]